MILDDGVRTYETKHRCLEEEELVRGRCVDPGISM